MKGEEEEEEEEDEGVESSRLFSPRGRKTGGSVAKQQKNSFFHLKGRRKRLL